MTKKVISIRINSELLDWFIKMAPDGYQKLICTVLEDYQHSRLLQQQKKVGRAQQIYLQYYARCFWHLKKDLEITQERISLVQNGLRKYGGVEGLRLASTLEPSYPEDTTHAHN